MNWIKNVFFYYDTKAFSEYLSFNVGNYLQKLYYTKSQINKKLVNQFHIYAMYLTLPRQYKCYLNEEQRKN